jgi:asparagine synthase (glutamine-hydrolysing)
MCGISGIISFKNEVRTYQSKLEKSINTIKSRGPNAQGFFYDDNIGLGHCRLSVIDTSEAANQPFFDLSHRYVIVFNGEIFNFKNLSNILTEKGIVLTTKSDTEILLNLYIIFGEKCLSMLEGFFVFCIYDIQTKKSFFARDRLGVKPLVFYIDSEKIIFSSEIKGVLAFDIPKIINKTSLIHYFHLNYIPNKETIFEHIFKLESSHYAIVENNDLKIREYYDLHHTFLKNELSNKYSAKKLTEILNEAVEKRLISDIPLGTFLSGGIDSCIITGLASKYRKIDSFSIGYKDHHFFDESDKALISAKKIGTNHHSFKLSQEDIENEIFNFLEIVDEPFADSSGLAYYILSKKTSQYIKVALTGDGADEIFGGYNKHLAEYRILHLSNIQQNILNFLPNLENLPQSRNNYFSNKLRQISKFINGINLSKRERYWQWCGFYQTSDLQNLFSDKFITNQDWDKSNKERLKYIHGISDNDDINQILASDQVLVLQGDMLRKVDMCTMANGQEARNPFLDNKVLEYVNSFDGNQKIDSNGRKKMLYETFKDIIPTEIINSPKKGFEIPISDLLNGALSSFINEKILNKDYIANQGIFNYSSIENIYKKFKGLNSHDSHAKLWALIVFQFWYEKYYK